MKKLSREQMKKVMGGGNAPVEPGPTVPPGSDGSCYCSDGMTGYCGTGSHKNTCYCQDLTGPIPRFYSGTGCPVHTN